MLNFSLINYWIENIDYSLDYQKFPKGNKKINIIPRIERTILPVDDNQAIVKLHFSIKKTNEVPFGIELSICGRFYCENWPKHEEGMSFIRTTSVQILFPYLRQAVSTITGMSNIPQYLLPVVNVANLFDDN